ncbi:MAG: diadenylate cyclase CdaA [Oscillospiraceae bacterium]|nr:diadenylate cyclase CdaA [Oscillospiraceae bacterium]
MAGRISSYISLFGIQDALDILLVAVLVYVAIQLFRRSNAFPVIKGVIFLVLVLGFSQIFRLHTLSFLLNSTLQVGVLAVIVLFQPELRKMLGQVGSAGGIAIGRNAPSDLEKAIPETLEACRVLSWERQGALIVFERRVNLSDVAKTGTVVDAAVTAELIKNIFYPKAPLHDGAVIVQHGRITGAGCMLPLTGNANLSRDLGMRHRAGIGMSENSDAVVVVVSEETGTVSAAIGGMLKRNLTLETLETLLRMELVPVAEKKKGGLLSMLRKSGGKEDGV